MIHIFLIVCPIRDEQWSRSLLERKKKMSLGRIIFNDVIGVKYCKKKKKTDTTCVVF